MSEGDVYNLLDTGANYVYVLDLNNTGEAGWDDFFGTVDLSSINLQTVLDNGYTANNPISNNMVSIDLENGNFLVGLNGSGKNSMFSSSISNHVFHSGDASVGSSILNVTPEAIFLNASNYNHDTSEVRFSGERALHYADDYSAKFGSRSLVDKAYVDSKVAPATLQTVLNNGGFANDPSTGNSININLSGGGSFQSFNNSVEGKFGSLNHSYEHFNTDFTSGTSYLSFYIGSSNNGTFRILNRDVQNNKEVAIQLKPSEGLVYEGDYSSDFTDRSLVDKEFVVNAIANSSGGDFIPLTGTEPNKPATGPIHFSGEYDVKTIVGDLYYDHEGSYQLSGGGTVMMSKSPNGDDRRVSTSTDSVNLVVNAGGGSVFNYFAINHDRISLHLPNDSRGITSDNDYTQNIQDFDFVQKKYVDNKVAPAKLPITLPSNVTGEAFAYRVGAMIYCYFNVSIDFTTENVVDFSIDSVGVILNTLRVLPAVNVSSGITELNSIEVDALRFKNIGENAVKTFKDVLVLIESDNPV